MLSFPESEALHDRERVRAGVGGALNVKRVDELVNADNYARGEELLERIVAMLTKLIEP